MSSYKDNLLSAFKNKSGRFYLTGFSRIGGGRIEEGLKRVLDRVESEASTNGIIKGAGIVGAVWALVSIGDRLDGDKKTSNVLPFGKNEEKENS